MERVAKVAFLVMPSTRQVTSSEAELAFSRIHARIAAYFLRFLTPYVRRLLEYALFLVAVALLSLLMLMHASFVHQARNNLNDGVIISARLMLSDWEPHHRRIEGSTW